MSQQKPIGQVGCLSRRQKLTDEIIDKVVFAFALPDQSWRRSGGHTGYAAAVAIMATNSPAVDTLSILMIFVSL